jgi:pimeloyl-ACP methyl ester carboxylesterase
MPSAKANGIEIAYDSFGTPADPALLLIRGFAGQMLGWHEDFCGRIAREGYFVVRFDNRDVGLSTKFDAVGAPDMGKLAVALQSGGEITVPYRLEDMADDAVGLLDALSIERAHVCGVSMGGMIAQLVAIRHPQRLRSLISYMSTTGEPGLPPATPEAQAAIISPPPEGREAAIEHTVAVHRALAGDELGLDEAWVRDMAERSWERSSYSEGALRQMAAIMAARPRTRALASVRVPTLVLHGSADPIIPVAHAHQTAEAIPGAELVVIEGLGHDIGPPGWPFSIPAIVEHLRKADA